MQTVLAVAGVSLCVVALVLASVCGSLLAADTIEAMGTVRAVVDDGDNLTSVCLVTDDDIYCITLDEKGRELGALDGTKVKIQGIAQERDDDIWVTVKKYETVDEQEEREE